MEKGGAGDPGTGLPIGETSENLKAAVAGETYEYTEMYPGFAATAREEGFDEVAEWFETLARAEKSHAGKFQETLDTLKTNNGSFLGMVLPRNEHLTYKQGPSIRCWITPIPMTLSMT